MPILHNKSYKAENQNKRGNIDLIDDHDVIRKEYHVIGSNIEPDACADMTYAANYVQQLDKSLTCF